MVKRYLVQDSAEALPCVLEQDQGGQSCGQHDWVHGFPEPETFTQFCAEKYEFFFILHRMKFDLVYQNYEQFSLPVMSDYWFASRWTHSGRQRDWLPWRHYFLLCTCSIQEDRKLSWYDWKFVDWDVKHLYHRNGNLQCNSKGSFVQKK